MSSEDVCDFCLNPIDSFYQIKELRRKLDVAKKALEWYAAHSGTYYVKYHGEMIAKVAKQALSEIEGK